MRNKKSEVKKKGFLMAPRAFLQWLLFALYIGLCVCLPFFLLASWWGLVAGAFLTLVFLSHLRFRGLMQLLTRLNVRPLPFAEAPHIHAAVKEYCRILNLPVPKINLMEVPALNLALVGWSRHTHHLILTRGTLTHLSRAQLCAVLGRVLCNARTGETPCETWLSQFLATLLMRPDTAALKGIHSTRRIYSLKLFATQALLFPLTLFPAFILRGMRNEADLDLKAIKLTRRPVALAEAMRKLEAYHERIPLTVPLSDAHLFLLPPRISDPLARVFFVPQKLAQRIHALESLRKVVT